MKKLITLKQPIHISDTVVKEIDAVILEVLSADDGVAFYGSTKRVHSARSYAWINIKEIGALSIPYSNIAGLEHLDGIASGLIPTEIDTPAKL